MIQGDGIKRRWRHGALPEDGSKGAERIGGAGVATFGTEGR